MILRWLGRTLMGMYEESKETYVRATSLQGVPATGSELEAFDQHARTLTVRNLQFIATIMFFLTAGAFPTDLLVFEIGSPAFMTLFWWRLAILLSCAAMLLSLRFLPGSRRHPTLLGSVIFSFAVAASGYLVGTYGGFESPLTYGIYTTPLLTILLIAPLRFRVFSTVLLVVVFALCFLVPHPEYLDHPLAGAPLVWLFGVVATTVGVGHVVYFLLRANFLQRVALDRIVAKQTEQLRQQAGSLLSIQEEGRKRIGQDIHDELGQLLTGLRMELDILEMVSQDPKAERDKLKKILNNAGRLLDSVHDSLDRILGDLFPLALETEGLEQTLRRMAESLRPRHEARCEIDPQAHLETLNREQSLTLYRLVQESLTNIVKHARAHSVDLTITADETALRFTIRDDGTGFELAEPTKPGAFGLAGLRERARWLGGTIRIDSRPGEGTTITGVLPRPSGEGKGAT